LSLSASMTAVAGSSINVTWATVGGASGSDWVGLYAAGSADTAPVDRRPTGGQSAGTVSLTAPSTAGNYEARYFSGTDSVRVAVSNPIVVTAPPSIIVYR